MIILQILAGVLLVPLTVVLLILFNVYVMHWMYLLSITLFAFVYSFLCAFVFHDLSATAYIFMIFIILYIIRMSYLSYRISSTIDKVKNYPLVRGDIRLKQYKFRMAFLFPLSFLNILKLLPGFISRELSRKAGFEIAGITDLILSHSIGTLIEVVSNEADIYFEIQ